MVASTRPNKMTFAILWAATTGDMVTGLAIKLLANRNRVGEGKTP